MEAKLFKTKSLGGDFNFWDFEIKANSLDKKRVILSFDNAMDLVNFSVAFQNLLKKHNCHAGLELDKEMGER